MNGHNHARASGRELRILLAAICVMVSALAMVRGTLATFNAKTVNGATFSSRSLYAPTGLSGVASGHTVVLNWTASSPNNGNGYALSSVAPTGTKGQGACPTTTVGAQPAYTFRSGVSAATTTSTDSSTVAYNANDGARACYLVQSSYNTGGVPPWAALPKWNSVNSFAGNTVAVTLGSAVVSIALINHSGGVANKLDAGDTIVVTFSQPMTPVATIDTTKTVCIDSQNNGVPQIYIAGTAAPNQSSCSSDYDAGTLSTVTGSASYGAGKSYSDMKISSVVFSGRVLTITVGAATGGTSNGLAAFSGVNWTYDPSASSGVSFKSTTGGYAICTTDGAGLCQPTTATSF